MILRPKREYKTLQIELIGRYTKLTEENYLSFNEMSNDDINVLRGQIEKDVISHIPQDTFIYQVDNRHYRFTAEEYNNYFKK